MRYPWINTALFCILLALLLSGLVGLTTGAERGRWILWLHAAAGYALVLMFVWKGRVIFDVLRRGRGLTFARIAFLLFTALTLALLATGVFWTTAGPARVSVFSVITVHAVLAIPVFVLFVWHVVARRYIVRVRPAIDRRAFFRFGALAVGGAAVWLASRTAKAALDLPAAGRRFTGSFETGSFTGRFPVVSWLFDFPAPLDASGWQLAVRGAVAQPLTLTYAELLALASEETEETLDCTGGWYTVQEWRGVPLARLLERAGLAAGAQSVTVMAVSGYYRRFPLDAAASLLLATEVAGSALDHGHGFPVRLVAPGYRGYDWVKWVTSIEVNTTSHLLQPPLPLQ
jgi:hypothetical protein